MPMLNPVSKADGDTTSIESLFVVRNRVIDYGHICYEERKTSVMLVRNIGKIGSNWRFLNGREGPLNIPWLHFSPSEGYLNVEEECEITVTIFGRPLFTAFRVANDDHEVNKSFEEKVVLRIDGGQQFKCVISGRITTTDGLGSVSTSASSCLSQSSLLENSDHFSTDIECAQGMAMGSHRVRPSVTTGNNEGDEPSILNKLVSAIGKWSTQESPRRRVSSVSHLNAISAASSSGFM